MSKDRDPLLSREQVEAICMMPNACGPKFPEVLDRSMLAGANLIKNFYEDRIRDGTLIPKSEVEAMLSDALGVDRVSVWAELGTKRGFGQRMDCECGRPYGGMKMQYVKLKNGGMDWRPFCPNCGKAAAHDTVQE